MTDFVVRKHICRLTEINSKEYLEQHAAMLAGKQLEQGAAAENAM